MRIFLMSTLKLFLTVLFSVSALSVALRAEDLIAHWDFSKGDLNAQNGKIICKTCGRSKISEDENSGKYLKTGDSPKENPEGIMTIKNYPELSPKEGFRMEVKFRVTEHKNVPAYFLLWDNKYIFTGPDNTENNKIHCGFTIGFQNTNKEIQKNGKLTPMAYLGFGKYTRAFSGTPLELKSGEIHTLSFEYDGINKGTFKFDGKINKIMSIKNGGPLAAAVYQVHIGDRVAGNYSHFPGDIFDLKLYALPLPDTPASIYTPGRHAFLRNEKNTFLYVNLINYRNEKVTNLEIRGTLKGVLPVSLKEAELLPGKNLLLKFPVETRLAVGKYPLELVLTGTVDKKTLSNRYTTEILIAPHHNDNMPAIVWQYMGNYKDWQKLGFTHIQHSVLTKQAEDESRISSDMQFLDDVLFNDFRWITEFHGIGYRERYPRYKRDGTIHNAKNLEASNLEAQNFLRKLAEKAAPIFAEHPAYDGLLVESEIRDYSQPSFGKYEPAAFRKFSGFEIPKEIDSKATPHYSAIKNFPLSRIVSENHPYLIYFRWFYQVGDGWNPLIGSISDIYKKKIKRPFFTFYDPAVRVPPLWGSGGNVDYLNHWTYAYPEPFNTSVVISEEQAMAEGCPNQGVMTMTQIICYRSATAPIGKKVEKEPDWVKEFPKAPYITLPPDSMQEAIWTMISRAVSGIMFHGYNSLIPDPTRNNYKTDKGYQCTNLKTKDVVGKLLNDVVKPLGPVLKRIPERPIEIAVLESFASSVFAHRGTYGWTGWIFDTNLLLHWANLSPGVIYEEKILRDGFGNIKVLFMPHCDVLTEPVFKAIQEFQRKGGLIVADEYVVPGILPDIQMKEYKRIKAADKDKAELQKKASELRSQLDKYYLPYSNASNMDLITRVRSYNSADYLFVINDRRTFGDYFGPYGLTMEKGLPNSGSVTVRRECGAVYDLVSHRPVPFENKNGGTVIPVNFTTNDGRVFLLLPTPIAKMQVSAPPSIKRGEPLNLEVKILDAKGNAVNALIPLQIIVSDANGNTTDDSCFAAAERGSWQKKIIPPLNAKTGVWNVRLKDQASGAAAEIKFNLQ